MYTVAGSQLFTSERMLEAESRIVELAGRTDGRRVGEVEVSLALLASTANGVTLNAGQTNMVRQMATSGSTGPARPRGCRVGEDHRAEGAG